MRHNIITYILILLLPTIAGIVVYTSMQEVLYRESIREFESEVSDIANYMDDQLEQAAALGKQLSKSRRIQNYQMSISLGTAEASYAAYEALGEFDSIRSAYNGISAFFVWFSKNDAILYNSACMYAYEFFDYIYLPEDREQLLSYNVRGTLLSSEVSSRQNSIDGTYLPYTVTLSLPYSNAKRYANLVVLLRQHRTNSV